MIFEFPRRFGAGLLYDLHVPCRQVRGRVTIKDMVPVNNAKFWVSRAPFSDSTSQGKCLLRLLIPALVRAFARFRTEGAEASRLGKVSATRARFLRAGIIVIDR